MASGEIRFALRRKYDRNGAEYLFGPIVLFNVVVFVRQDPRDPDTYHAIVKPYTGPGDENQLPSLDAATVKR